jgi:gliding motility-associated-like protein
MLMRQYQLFTIFALGLLFTVTSIRAQTIIFTNNGASYTNTDQVTNDVYGPVDISNCTSISFSINYNFSLPYPGAGNMESSDECPFGIPPCQGDPNDPYGGGCDQCWDFFYVQFQINGVTVNSKLVGVPGMTAQSGTVTYGPVCTNGAATAGLIVQTNTWAANETITFNSISITCWDASSSNLTANPNPACAGMPFTLGATLNHPNDVSGQVWTGPGTITPPTSLTPTVTNAPVGTNTYTLTVTDDNGCTKTNSIDVQVTPGPTMTDPADQIVCAGDPVSTVFVGTGNPTFNWTNSNINIGLGASGSGDISFTAASVVAPTTGTITVTPSENGCVGPAQTFTITVNPLPSVNQPNNVVICAGLAVNVPFTGTAGATFNWTNDNTAIGLGASGTGNISFVTPLVANQEVATITVTPVRNGCPGPPVSFTITVNPRPTVTDPPDMSVCAGNPVAVVFNGTGNPTFNWINSNTNIGLSSNGSGDISFTAANVTVPTTGTITVTPTANGCTGTNQSFIITVNPTPTVNQPNNVVVCSGAPVITTITGSSGASFSWTNDNTSIGLGAAGLGSINFTAANVSTQQVANIFITPMINGCPGAPVSYTITVNPIPTVVDPPNQTVCGGSVVSVVFSGAVNPTFNWSNSNIAIGLGSSGTGNINFTAANVGVPTTGNLTVIPTENGCTGTQQNFTITVTPAPSVNQPGNITACANTSVMAAFSGTSGATFNWTNNNTAIGLAASGTGDLNFIAAGVATQQTATITVTPVVGTCSGTALTFTIVINPAPTVVDPPNQTVCSGTVVAVNFMGTNNPTFNWTNNNTAIGLAASGAGNISFTAGAVGVGAITVTPVENGCTGASQSFNITVIGAPVVDQPAAMDACSGNAVATTFTGTSGATFAWTNSNTAIGLGASGTGNIAFTAANVGVVTAGTISVTPNLGGCTGAAQSFVITINPLPTINITSVVCATDLLTYSVTLSTNGATVTATAGTVTGSGGNFTVSGITAGTNVNISSTNTATGCQLVQSVNAPNCNCAPVNAPGMPNSPTICEGAAIPALTVTTDPGNTVDWYTAATGGTLLLMGNTSYTPMGPLSAGVYNFYAESRDTNSNCLSSTRLQLTLTVNALPAVSQPMNQTVCAGDPVGVVFSGTSSATFNWTNSEPGIGLAATGAGDISFTATNAGSTPLAGNFTVTPSLNGCSGAAQNFSITVNPIPTLTAPMNQTVCGGAPVMAVFSGAPGATFSWTNSNTAIGLAASGTGNINFTAANVAAPTIGNLTVVPMLAGCTGSTQNFSITVNPLPSVMAPANQSGCAGSTIAVNFSGSSGATFNWTNSNTAIGLPASGMGNISFMSINAGASPIVANLVVTPTQNGCTGAVQNFSITINPRPSITVNSTTCAPDLLTYSVNLASNANTITATLGTVTGSGGNFNITGIPNGAAVILTATITATGCSIQQSVNPPNCTCPPLTAPNGPNFPVICEGVPTPALMVNAPGAGLTVDWFTTPTGGVPVFVGSNTYTPPGPFTPGTYIFYAETREISSNCKSPTRTPVFLTVNSAPSMTQPVNQSVCAGFTISVGFNGTSGAMFNWTNSSPSIGLPATGSGNITFSAVNASLAPIVATIVVTPTLLGCNGTPRTFTITVLPSPSLTDPADIAACVGQSVSANFSGTAGATFSWTNSNTGIGLPANGAGNISFTANTAGSSTVTVIPMANGCSGTPQTFNITVISNPVVTNPGNQAVCAGANLAVNFTGTPGINYSWTNSNASIGLPVSGMGNLNFSAANVGTVQTAQITVTPVFGACVGQSQTFSITANPLPVAGISGNTTICSGSSTTLTAMGGSSFSWAGGQTSAAITVSPASTTTYTATVTANACSSSATATVTVNQHTSATVNALTCDPAQVGSVSVVIPNFKGCDSTITTVTTLDVANCAPALTLSNGSVSCFGAGDGSLSLSAGGGLAPYNYAWSNGSNQMGAGMISSAGTTIQLPNLPAGTYTVTVTGANGLTKTISATVSSPAVLVTQATAQLAFGQFPLSCFGATDATIQTLTSGGTTAYQYAWSVAGQTGAVLSNIGAGTYTVTITDANQCTVTGSATVIAPPPLSFGISIESVECGEDVATALIIPSGGATPFTVKVDGVSTFGGLMPSIPDGQHLVEISDAYGCTADTTVVVDLPPVPVITLPTEETVSLGETLVLQAQTNLTSWQSLVWTPLPDSACANCLSQAWIPQVSGVYEVAITDTFGCSATASVRVLVRKQIDIYIPNIFSPNLDGNNDFWAFNAGPSVVALNSLQIFDRWGSMVYFWDAPIPVNEWPGWDGTYKGDKLNPGVFVYYLKVRLANGEEVLKKGDVTVIR